MKTWVKDGLFGVSLAVVLSTTIAVIWHLINPYILYKTVYQFFLLPAIVIILPIALRYDTESNVVPVILITLTIIIAIIFYFFVGSVMGKIIRKIKVVS